MCDAGRDDVRRGDATARGSALATEVAKTGGHSSHGTDIVSLNDRGELPHQECATLEIPSRQSSPRASVRRRPAPAIEALATVRFQARHPRTVGHAHASERVARVRIGRGGDRSRRPPRCRARAHPRAMSLPRRSRSESSVFSTRPVSRSTTPRRAMPPMARAHGSPASDALKAAAWPPKSAIEIPFRASRARLGESAIEVPFRASRARLGEPLLAVTRSPGRPRPRLDSVSTRREHSCTTTASSSTNAC
jgi:hypothetical protein